MNYLLGPNEHVFDTVSCRADDFKPMGSYLILHGLEGSGPDHWQTWLAASPARPRRPASPSRTCPTRSILAPSEWNHALDTELSGLLESPTFCHSPACLLWLRAIARPTTSALASRVFLVAPPWRDDLTRSRAFSTTAHGPAT